MITRSEYNKALDVVEAYHKQLFVDKIAEVRGTKFKDWHNFTMCGTRLKSILEQIDDYTEEYDKNIYLENLTWKEFATFRHAGKVSWKEFVELRGY